MGGLVMAGSSDELAAVEDSAIAELAEAVVTGADPAEIVRLADSVLDRAVLEAAWKGSA